MRGPLASGRPLRQIVETIVSRDLSHEARQRAIATFARAQLAKGLDQNRQATGRTVPYDQIVDGRTGAPLETVNPDNGRIIFRFDVATNELFAWIADQLVLHAPRRRGRYAESFQLYAGGRMTGPRAALPRADEYVFVSTVPYAGKIERGLSPQAPDGVFQAVAALAKVRFGDVAAIRFTYRPNAEFGLPAGGPRPRTPVIVVRLG